MQITPIMPAPERMVIAFPTEKSVNTPRPILPKALPTWQTEASRAPEINALVAAPARDCSSIQLTYFGK